jgi:hypothetical protein
MKQDDLVLVPYTQFGTASGNYDGSSSQFYGDRQKAVGYYLSKDFINNLRFQTDEFGGSVVIYATLDQDPNDDTDTDWFSIYTFPGDSTTDGSTVVTTDYSTSVYGKFTWIRAKVENFTAGDIDKITLSY